MDKELKESYDTYMAVVGLFQGKDNNMVVDVIENLAARMLLILTDDEHPLKDMWKRFEGDVLDKIDRMSR